MYRRIWLLLILLCALISGCAGDPALTRDQWQTQHTHHFSGVSVQQILDASQQVLTLADHDFTYQYPKGQLIAERKWSIYEVIAAAFGTDYWYIDAQESGDGVDLTLRISRQQMNIAPTPTTGYQVGVGAATMPGQAVESPFPYDLFWSRLDYELGRSKNWVTCSQAKSGKKLNEKRFDDILCSVTTDDKLPSQTILPSH